MKNFKFFVFFVAALLVASSAFALQCKDGNDTSDECWTRVKIGEDYGTLVSRGHVLVASFAGKTYDLNDGFLARISTNSTDKVLGVAQSRIATGESALIMVKGRGVVKLDGSLTTVVSGDALANLATGSAVEAAATVATAKPKVGLALQSGSDASIQTEATGKAGNAIYAYIDV